MRPESSEVIKTAEEYLRKAREAVDKALMEEKRRLFVSSCVCLSSTNLDEGGYESHRKVVEAIMSGQPLFKFNFGGFGERLVHAACSNEDLFFVHRPGDSWDRRTYEPGNFWYRNKLFRVNYFAFGPSFMFKPDGRICTTHFTKQVEQWDENVWNPVSTTKRLEACQDEIIHHLYGCCREFLNIYGSGCSLRDLYVFSKFWTALKSLPYRDYLSEWNLLFSGGDRAMKLKFLDALEERCLR